MNRAILALAFAGLLSAVPASAQSPVFTVPSPRLSTNSSGTIAVTNTFQMIWDVSLGRAGCTIQNNGSSAMYVSMAPASLTPTLTNSIKLASGQAAYCHSGGIVLTGQVWITGTSGDAFYANSQ